MDRFASSAAVAAAPASAPRSSDAGAALFAAATSLLDHLTRGQRIDAAVLRAAMETAFYGSDTEGVWDWKAAYEVCEAAQILFLRKFGPAMRARTTSPEAMLPMLAKIAQLLPTHTRRTEESQALQQFSTPIALGFAASVAAAITPADLVLEPSAGTGLLAIFAELCGASLALNELAETRAALLKRLFPGIGVTRFDAAQIDDHLDANVRPSVVLMNPPFSALAQPVQCREAVARRDRLIEKLACLAPVHGALDQIVQRFGADMVAEVTGRSRRVVRRGDRLCVENRAGAANLAEAQAFMDDAKRILVFSEAGGTGRSYHAELSAKNRRLRVHSLLEAGWKADAAIQGLGRTNRTNQAQPPLFRPIATNVKAEKRFLSTIARRLDTLGAITKGQRQTGGQGLFRPEDNFESFYARDALRQLYVLLVMGKVEHCSLAEFEDATGLKLTDSAGIRDELPPITTFLNRLLALTIDLQNILFAAFEQLLGARIEGAIASGTYDIGLETLSAESFVVTDRQTIYAHPGTGERPRPADLAAHGRHPSRNPQFLRTRGRRPRLRAIESGARPAAVDQRRNLAAPADGAPSPPLFLDQRMEGDRRRAGPAARARTDPARLVLRGRARRGARADNRPRLFRPQRRPRALALPPGAQARRSSGRRLEF